MLVEAISNRVGSGDEAIGSVRRVAIGEQKEGDLTRSLLRQAMNLVGWLCERLSHGCCVFDVLAVVVGHLSGMLERSQRSK